MPALIFLFSMKAAGKLLQAGRKKFPGLPPAKYRSKLKLMRK